jgi:hypothetical protein
MQAQNPEKIPGAPGDVEQYIIQLLEASGKMTTKDLHAAVDAVGLSCPDEPVRYLNKLRHQGKIQGEASVKYKGWVWWV